jgi:hypothetical protein
LTARKYVAREYEVGTVLAAQRRVLRLLAGYIGKQDQATLTTDGRGFMTWGELRHHALSAARLRVKGGR